MDFVFPALIESRENMTKSFLFFRAWANAPALCIGDSLP